MSIATRLSKASKHRRSGMLVESAFYRNIQPFRAGWWQGDAVCCGDLTAFSNRLSADLRTALVSVSFVLSVVDIFLFGVLP